MRADDKTEAAVMDVIGRFAEAYAARDMDATLAVFTPDSDVVAIGTGVDERCVGLDEFRQVVERDWSQSEAASIEIGWHSVSAAGSVAWVAADAIIQAMVEGQELRLPIRFTAVLVKHGDSWLLAQQHVSMPSAAQAEGESFPT